MLWIWLLAASAGVQFVDEAEKRGLDFQHVSGSADKAALLDTMSGGVAWLDYDNDGRLDLYLVNGGRWDDLKSSRRSVSNALFRQNDDGSFSNATEQAGVGGAHWGMGAAAADYDNDGDIDLYVCNYGPNHLYRNNGDGTFSEVAEAAGTANPKWSSSAAWADYDGDGDLDLYVVNYVEFDFDKAHQRTCNYRTLQVHCGPKGMIGAPDALYRNEGDGTFSEVTAAAGMAVGPSYGLGAVWSDADGDGDPDLYVANDSRANFLFVNQGGGRFEEKGLMAGLALNEDGNAQAGMGIAWADYDGDGRPDIYVTHFSDDYNTLYRNLGNTVFRDVSYQAGLAFSSRPYLGWGTQFFDYDNDGRLDLFVANGHVYPQVDDFQIGTSYLQSKLLYRNLGSGRFEEISSAAGADLRRPTAARGAAFADFDDDGDIDVAVNNLDGRPQLFVNHGGDRAGHWISLDLEGTSSNRNAVGSQATVVAGGRSQVLEVQAGASFQSTNGLRLHFGLGPEKRVRKLILRWPSGKVQSFEDLAGDRRYLLKEGEEIRSQEEVRRPEAGGRGGRAGGTGQ